MGSRPKLLAVIGSIYEAAMDPVRWPSVLRDAAAIVGSASGVLAFQDFAGEELNFIESVGRDPSCWKSYNEHYFFISPYVPMMKNAGERCYATQDLISDRALTRTEFYNDWLLPQDIHFHAGAVVLRTPQAAALLEFQLSKAQGPFTEQSRRMIGQLAPHLRRSIAIGRKLRTLSEARTPLLERIVQMDTSVILLDERGRPVFLNPSAEILLRLNPGLTATHHGIHASDTDLDDHLQRLIAASLLTARGKGDSAGGSFVLHAAGPLAPVVVTVTPLGLLRPGSTLHTDGICAAVFLAARPAEPGLDGRFKVLFGLTAAEARVAMALLDGANAEEIGQRLHVSRETVRSQIKAIYGKTGVKRQAQFIALAMSNRVRRED